MALGNLQFPEEYRAVAHGAIVFTPEGCRMLKSSREVIQRVYMKDLVYDCPLPRRTLQ